MRPDEEEYRRIPVGSRPAMVPLRNRMIWPRRRAAAMAAVLVTVTATLGLLVPGLGRGSLQGDEAIYGAVALDSARSTRALIPELDGRIYVNKPPLLFWSLRASYFLIGPSTFSSRLPGILAGLLLALWILRAGARRGAAWTGALAAILVLSTPTSLGLAGDRGFRHVCTDSLLVLAVFVAVEAWSDWLRARRPGSLVTSALAAALGSAVKGPLATLFVALGMVAAPRGGGREPEGEARERPSPAVGASLVVGAGLLVTAIWLLALQLGGTPRLWARLVDRNLVERVVRGIDSAHVQPATFFVQSVAGDFGPWLLLALPALVAAWRLPRDTTVELRRDLALPALAILAFSLSASKLSWYLLPAYPFLALVLARGAGALWTLSRSPIAKALLGILVVAATGFRVAAAAPQAAAQGLRPVAPLLTAVAALERSGLQRLHVDPDLGFGAPAGGLTAEEYFFVGSRKWTSRTWPVTVPTSPGCTAFLTGSEARLGEIAGIETGTIRRIERSRPDVGPLWLAVCCLGDAAGAPPS